MTLWLAAGAGVCCALVPCAAMALAGSAERRLVGLQMTSLVLVFALVIFAIAAGRPILVDIGLTAAVMSYGGGLVFARFLEKHL